MQKNRYYGYEDHEIVVYLIDFERKGGNFYKSVMFDFRADGDLDLFCQVMEIEKGNNSVMEICNVCTTKRLQRGTYYDLHVSELKRLQYHREYLRDSALLAYAFILNEELRNRPLALFDKSRVLNLADTYAEVTGSQGGKMPKQLTDGKLRVNKVGQGNHNEILEHDTPVLVYDMGAPLRSAQSEVRKLIDARMEEYKKSTPILIISHWDYDHVLQLKCMTDEELACFSHVYCPAQIKSKTAREIMDRIQQVHSKSKVHVLAKWKRTFQADYPSMVKERGKNGFSLYVGQDHKNINYCGLVLFVNGTLGSALLTGDCILAQASDVLNCEVGLKKTPYPMRWHKLVVPHHGGDYPNRKYRRYDLPSVENRADRFAEEVIYSVGKNSYGHPAPGEVEFLRTKFRESSQTNELSDAESFIERTI